MKKLFLILVCASTTLWGMDNGAVGAIKKFSYGRVAKEIFNEKRELAKGTFGRKYLRETVLIVPGVIFNVLGEVYQQPFLSNIGLISVGTGIGLFLCKTYNDLRDGTLE